MVGDLNQICSKAQSSSSSSTGIFCDKNNRCSPCGCNRCCPNTVINDHTYSLLKRICRKIIKNYNRQQCREKYTIFDGGNSVNLRIHRESSLHKQDLERETKYQNNMDSIGYRDQRRRSDRRNDYLIASKGRPGRHRKSEDFDKGQFERNRKSETERRASETDHGVRKTTREANKKASSEPEIKGKNARKKNVESEEIGGKKPKASHKQEGSDNKRNLGSGEIGGTNAKGSHKQEGSDNKRNLETGEIGGKKAKGSHKQEGSDNDDLKVNKKQKGKSVDRSDDNGTKQDGKTKLKETNAAALAAEKAKDKKIASNDIGPNKSIKERHDSNKINSLAVDEKKGSKQLQSVKGGDYDKKSQARPDKDKNRQINKDDNERGKEHIKRKSGKGKRPGVDKSNEIGDEGTTTKDRVSDRYDDLREKTHKKSKSEKGKSQSIEYRKSKSRGSKIINRNNSPPGENSEKRLTKSTKEKIEENQFGTPRASKKRKTARHLDSSMGKYPTKKQQRIQRYGSEKSKTTIGRFERRILRTSRADEIRPCDVLRAQLEQRDLARSHRDPCQPCYPCRTCVPCQPSCVLNICQRQKCVC